MSRSSHGAAEKIRPEIEPITQATGRHGQRSAGAGPNTDLVEKQGPNADPQGLSSDLQGPHFDPRGPQMDPCQHYAAWRQAQKALAKTAAHCLRELATTKEWAADLQICERVVRRWATEEQIIPETRICQILRLAKGYRDRLRELEAELDDAFSAMLQRAYGSAGNRSM